ncbi:ribbon-helix-helix domain-containing protein [Patescibacteria group bacterium]|nr:ribbon-helix-helix domain-containing protein [Patescibacteria group bacterium]
MNTVNISLPVKLRKQAQELVDGGYYASFSDLVRDSLRRVVTKNKYDLMLEEAIEYEKNGGAVILKTPKDIDKYMDSL